VRGVLGWRRRQCGAVATEGEVGGVEIGVGSGGGNHGRLEWLEEPFNGVTVGVMAQLFGQLKNPNDKSGGH